MYLKRNILPHCEISSDEIYWVKENRNSISHTQICPLHEGTQDGVRQRLISSIYSLLALYFVREKEILSTISYFFILLFEVSSIFYVRIIYYKYKYNTTSIMRKISYSFMTSTLASAVCFSFWWCLGPLGNWYWPDHFKNRLLKSTIAI